jgi:Fic family protein
LHAGHGMEGTTSVSNPESRAINEKEQRALTRRLIREEFSQIQPLWVERELMMLTALRRKFGNDLDKPIILGAIGQFMFQNTQGASHRYDDHSSGNQPVRPSRLTNIESISTSTGIPRESVRRKVGELLEIGWLTRDTKGGLFVTAQAATDLDDASQLIFRQIEDVFQLITGMLAARGEAILVKPEQDPSGH